MLKGRASEEPRVRMGEFDCCVVHWCSGVSAQYAVHACDATGGGLGLLIVPRGRDGGVLVSGRFDIEQIVFMVAELG